MRILIACEESQTVCKAFRAKGHEAYSCDILPCSGGHPEWHIQGDVLPQLEKDWDMIIAHPPCTYFSNAGMCNLTRKNSDDAYRENRKRLTLEAFEFTMKIANAPIPKIAIENPVGYLNTHWRKPDQIIQPFQYGHSVNKKTCLWLKNLPLLKPTKIVEKDKITIWEGTGAKISQWYKDTLKEAR
jgi:site-specific DNA-cytosine methylase